MAIINKINFFSKSLMMRLDVNVLFSDRFNRDDYEILYLLHGYSEDCNSWLYNSRIAEHINSCSMIVVLPSGFNTFYFDTHLKAQTMISQEIPLLLEKMFALDSNKECYIGGLSMGGFGALILGLNGKNFKGIISLSGSVDIEDRFENLETVFNSRWAYSIYNSIKVAKEHHGQKVDLFSQIKAHDKPLRLYIACGTRDHLIAMNEKFIANILALNSDKIDFYHEITQDAGHDWGYWDLQIKNALDWIDKDNKI